jgi:hypothetical protein
MEMRKIIFGGIIVAVASFVWLGTSQAIPPELNDLGLRCSQSADTFDPSSYHDRVLAEFCRLKQGADDEDIRYELSLQLVLIAEHQENGSVSDYAKWVYANVPAYREIVDRIVREQKEAKSATTKGNE